MQPAELVGTDRYKIGGSGKPTLKRLRTGYKVGTRFLVALECIDPFDVEDQIKAVFNEKFNLVAGLEYFSGCERKMIQEFWKVYAENMLDDNDDNDDDEDEDSYDDDDEDSDDDEENDENCDDEDDEGENINDEIDVKINVRVKRPKIIKRVRATKASKSSRATKCTECSECDKIRKPIEYICNGCKFEFKTKRNLTRHIKNESCREKRIECNLCRSKFTTSNSMYRHRKYHCKNRDESLDEQYLMLI